MSEPQYAGPHDRFTYQYAAEPDPAAVYGRDASVYEHPNVTTTKAVHWLGEVRKGYWMSACGRAALMYDHPRDPAGVPEGARCRGAGCRQRWAKLVAETTSEN